MTHHQRSWVLLVLKLVSGIVILPQIVAKSYGEDVAFTIPALMAGKTNQKHVDYCMKQFEKMVTATMKNSLNKNPAGASMLMGKITQQLLSCVWRGDQGNSPEMTIPDHDIYLQGGDVQDLSIQDDRMDQDYTFRPVPEEVIRQIGKFHSRLDSKRFSQRLRDDFQAKIREFVAADLYKTDYQTNYGILIKQMLYEMTEVMLRPRIRTKVQIIIDKRLNPYINNKISVRILQSGRRFDEQLASSGMEELLNTLAHVGENSKAIEIPDCEFEEIEPTIDCVFSYVAALVLFESLVMHGHRPLIVWEPFSIKLLNNLEVLLVKILANHIDDEGQPGMSGYRTEEKPTFMADAFEARRLLLTCMHMIRVRYDRMSKSKNAPPKPAEDKEIDECTKKGLEKAEGVKNNIINKSGSTGLDPGMQELVNSLEGPNILEVFNESLAYHAKMKGFLEFTRIMIDGRLLSTQGECERSAAWNIVKEWKETKIGNGPKRMIALYEKGTLPDITCKVPKVQEVSTFKIISDPCWRPLIETLMIVQHTTSLNRASLDMLYWGNPIMMEFIWSAEFALSTQDVPE